MGDNTPEFERKQYNKQNIVFNHNPNSFFYMSAIKNNEMPSRDECDNLDPSYNSNQWITLCNSINFPTNKDNCKKVAYCKNFDRVKELYDNRNEYSASGQLYLDYNEEHKKEFNKLISLGVGAGFFGYLTLQKIFSILS